MKYNFEIDSYIGYPISKGWVREQLNKVKGQPCVVRVNSYGGDVQHALDIRQQFIDHGDVTVHIVGMTASAATILAMGAKKICMSKYALMLIHHCSQWVDKWGSMNADQIKEAIDDLKKSQENLSTIDDVIASIYVQKTGKSVEDIKKAMTDAKWLSADECLALGLIDDIIEEGEKATITDADRAHFMACGFPIPGESEPAAVDDEAAEEKKLNSMLSKIKDMLGIKPKVKENTMTTTDEFKTVNALLGVENVEVNDSEAVQISKEQMTTINAKLKSQEDELSAKNEEIENLKKGDGDSTQEVFDQPEEAANIAKETRDRYNALKDSL